MNIYLNSLKKVGKVRFTETMRVKLKQKVKHSNPKLTADLR